jgi:hypothetical protein
MLNWRSTVVIGSVEKIWTVDSCPGSVGRAQQKNRSELPDLGTWTDSRQIFGKMHKI